MFERLSQSLAGNTILAVVLKKKFKGLASQLLKLKNECSKPSSITIKSSNPEIIISSWTAVHPCNRAWRAVLCSSQQADYTICSTSRLLLPLLKPTNLEFNLFLHNQFASTDALGACQPVSRH